MRIRKAQPADLKRISEIEASTFNSPYDPLLINYLYSSHEETFLVACEDDVIGYIIGILDGSEGHIISLAVEEEFRGRRIGTHLVKRLLEIFKREGAERAKLEVRKHNVGAQNLYKKLGFSTVKELPDYYKNSDDGILMMKKV